MNSKLWTSKHLNIKVKKKAVEKGGGDKDGSPTMDENVFIN